MRQRPHSAIFRFSRRTRRPVALILALMIGWSGVPLDPRILADGYYDGDGNWIEDYSYTDTSTDTDGDGLSDYDESYIFWTDTLLTDTDGDGISDYDEVHTYFTSPTVFDGAPTDTDGDGLPDTDEIDFYSTDPWSSDTDGDGVSDYAEITIYYTNPTVSDTAESSPPQDSDGDGLTDSEESSYGTDPSSADSDGDGYSDYEEVVTSYTNPLDSSSYSGSSYYYSYGNTYGDTDGDGLADNEEVSYFYTDPYKADTDEDGLTDYEEITGLYISTWIESTHTYSMDEGDGNISYYEYTHTESYSSTEYPDPRDADTDNDLLPDGYEYHQGLNPVVPSDGLQDHDNDGLTRGQEYVLGTNYLNADTDGDGYSDGTEVFAGTDPLDASSSPTTEPDPGSGGSEPTGSGSNPSSGSEAPTPPVEPTAPAPPPAPIPNPSAAPSPQALWFRVHGFDPNDSTQLGADLDGDGLTLQQEYAYKTNPRRADTDGDGLSDGLEITGWEVATRDYSDSLNWAYSNPAYDPETGEPLPVVAPSLPRFVSHPVLTDSDGDGYTDHWEWLRRTDPYNPFDLLSYSSWELPTHFAYQHSWMNGYDDEDGDGINNAAEFTHRTDPFSSDTDGDGLSDNDEIQGVQVPVEPSGYYETTSYWDYDSAGEYVELTQSYWVTDTTSPSSYQLPPTDPTKADSDGDGFDDGYEILHGMNPTGAADGLSDLDGDGLSIGQETALGSSGDWYDSDGDGLSDYQEVVILGPVMELLGRPGFDPNDPEDGWGDWDGDGLRNAEEYTLFHTDLLAADTDGDGWNDLVELMAGTDPRDPLEHPMTEGEAEDPETPTEDNNTPVAPVDTETLGLVGISRPGSGSILNGLSLDQYLPDYDDAKDVARPGAHSLPNRFKGRENPGGFSFRVSGGELLYHGVQRDLFQDEDDPPLYQAYGMMDNILTALAPDIKRSEVRERIGSDEDSEESVDTVTPGQIRTQVTDALLGAVHSSPQLLIPFIPSEWGASYHLPSANNDFHAERIEAGFYRYQAVLPPPLPTYTELTIHNLRLDEMRWILNQGDNAVPQIKRWIAQVTFQPNSRFGMIQLLPVDPAEPGFGMLRMEGGMLVCQNGMSSGEFVNVISTGDEVGASVEFLIPELDEQGNDTGRLTEATELKVAKMEHSLSVGGVLTIDDDPDRFYVRLTGLPDLQNVSIELETRSNPDTEYNDEPTKIELTYDADKEYWLSQSQMLVSDNVDDDYSANGVGVDYEPNDRTHLVQLGGEVVVSKVTFNNVSHAIEIAAPVKVKKTVKVRLVICQQGPFWDHELCWGPGQAAAVEKTLKERFAQVGVKIEVSTVAGPHIGVFGQISSPYISGTTQEIPGDSIDLFTADTAASRAEATIYLVRQCKLLNNFRPGESVIEKYMIPAHKAAGYQYRSLVSLLDSTDYTGPHELLHLLLDAAHRDYSFEHGIEKMLWHPTKQGNSITDTKRISSRQERKILISPLAK